MSNNAKHSEVEMNTDEVLVTTDVDAEGMSKGRFRWPMTVGATVVAADGRRFGGRLWGVGPLGGLVRSWPWEPRTWLALAVPGDDVAINDSGWATFTKARVVAVGDRFEIGVLAGKARPARAPALFETVESGDSGVPAVAGYGGRARAPAFGQSLAGFGGQASAGACGQSMVSDRGQSESGAGGMAVSFSLGSSSVGDDGIAVCGAGGCVRGGDNAFLVAEYRTNAEYPNNIGLSTGRVGHNGIMPGVWYEGGPDGLVAVANNDPRVEAPPK